MNTLTFVPDGSIISTTMTSQEARITFKLPPEVHRKLKRLARLRGRPMIAVIESLVDTDLARLEEQKRGEQESHPKTK